MDLIYTSYRRQTGHSKTGPDWLQEGHTLSAVSPQNILLFTTTTRLRAGENDGTPVSGWGGHVYSVDLNTPWDACLVCSLESSATCLAWDSTTGSRFVVADSSGNLTVWEMGDGSVSTWSQVAGAKYLQETFLAASFFLRSRPIGLNEELKDSSLYNQKFSAWGGAGWTASPVRGCVLVSASGLLVCVAFPPAGDQEPVTKSRSLGLGRRRVLYADIATTKDGKLLVAACGPESPVVVYTVAAFMGGEGDLVVRINTHSSFSLHQSLDETAWVDKVCSLKFLLGDCTEALVVGVAGQEGGRVQLWELEHKTRQVHKLFTGTVSNPAKVVPEWRYSDEFSGVGVAGLVGVATPHFSVMGGRKPACYIAVAFSDGSVQCLLRDSLQQIESVELPRGGNLTTGGASHRVSVTICSLCFTSTGNCLLVTDSLGQLYLYRMSPITDPGGPPSPPYTVTMLEYCLVSGRDWWDLVLAARPNKLEAICDKFTELFFSQPTGVQQYYFARFMAIRSSLYRMSVSSQYRAGDTTALLMLQSINGAFRSLLRPADSSLNEDPWSMLEHVLSGSEEPVSPDLEQLVTGSGLSRDLGVGDTGTVASLNQLAVWVTTLALHLLAAVPEYKNKRGPGYGLLVQDPQQGPPALSLLRELLAMIKLWNLSRASVSLSTDKESDLISRLFSMVTRLAKKQDEEALVDECLMLPHKVMIPPLDTLTSPRGVLGCLQSMSSPLSFTLCTEPDLPSLTPTRFLEGLAYTEDPNSNFFYDCVQKLYLGQCPPSIKKCSRCSAVTQAKSASKSSFSRMWEKRWNRNCLCGGPWKAVQMS